MLGLSKIQMMALHWHKFRTENFKLVWLLLHQRVSVRAADYSLQRQNTSGMKAPMATKIGSMEELSSSA